MASRLALAFAIVVLIAVAVLGALTWRTTRHELASLMRSREATTERNAATLLAAAYASSSSWQTANVGPARVFARAGGATLGVVTTNGAVVVAPQLVPGELVRAANGRFSVVELGPVIRIPVIVGGARVGTGVLRFRVGAPTAEDRVRQAVGRTVVWGGVVSTLVALVAGLVVSRQITRPLRRLTRAARAVAAGDRSARADVASEPAELGELGRAFDLMAETIEREDRLRRAFAADVAHELRTPLAIVQAQLEELVDGVEPPSPDRLASLHEETLRLARIVGDVETLAAAEGARFRLERHRVDLAEVAREAVEHLHAQADAAGLEIEEELRPAPVDADRARLEQIARNLLGNALKFTPAGGRVTVSVASLNGKAQLVVEDNGPGLAEDELPHVFERFWRGESGRQIEGSGVGLAVAAELVHAHGGEITAERGRDGGARFTVTFPCP
jgi:two-component system sensor histidine kinase BaeS